MAVPKTGLLGSETSFAVLRAISSTRFKAGQAIAVVRLLSATALGRVYMVRECILSDSLSESAICRKLATTVAQ